MLWTDVVVAGWLLTNLAAFLGAAYLAYLAFRDYFVARNPKALGIQRLVRLETAGILWRSGVLRSITTMTFLAIAVPSLRSLPERTSLLAGSWALFLSGITAGFTTRDLIARSRISRNIAHDR